jgi:ribosomal protein S27E
MIGGEMQFSQLHVRYWRTQGMPVAVKCPECGESGEVPRSKVGREMRCNTCGHEFEVLAPPTGSQRYRYKMIPLEPIVAVRDSDPAEEAAAHLSELVEKYAQQGWEFHRVDAIGCVRSSGFFGALLGIPNQQFNYYIVTFRRGVAE